MFENLLQFKGAFRKYQQDVLDEFDTHYEDNCIHIVAPPGSGKTILGIELLRRVNKKTLVLVPTIALRSQWIDRVKQHFAVGQNYEFLSTDIDIDAPLTIDTYQGFYARYKSSNGTYNEEFDYECLVLDEAHHLKSSWYDSLINVIETKQVSTISLTATPPYDSVREDWDKYVNLNGIIDVMISIPVLVDEKNLCPHQDLIYLTIPTNEERAKLKTRKTGIDNLFKTISNNTIFMDYLYNLDFIQQPQHFQDMIFEKIDLYIPIVKMLTDANYKVSNQVYKIIGMTTKSLRAKIDNEHIAMVVNEYVLKDFVRNDNYTPLQRELINEIDALRKYGLIAKNQIDIDAIYDDCGIISKSLSKINAINTIINTESKSNYEPMKAVVLCDYINDPYSQTYSSKTYGTFDLFNSIVTNTEASAAMLCGKYLIVSKNHSFALNDMLNRELPFNEYEYNNAYSLLRISDSMKSKVINNVTKLLMKGEINTLVGTQSLLGEGWDCDSVNTLIIASNVKTFVTSNQVRGRSFRVNPNFAKKVANIWHLCAVDIDGNYIDDMDVMLSRFETFVGISRQNDNCTLDSGLERYEVINDLNSTLVSISSKSFKYNSIKNANKFMLNSSKKRSKLFKEWQQALEKGTKLDWVYSVSNFYDKKHPNKTIEQAMFFNIIFIAGYVFLMSLCLSLNPLRIRVTAIENYWLVIVVLAVLVLLILILYNWRLYWYAILNIRRDKQLIKLSKAVYYTMVELDLFKNNNKNITKHPVLHNMKFYTKIVVEGLSIQDQQLFADAIYELNTYDWNMRYLLKVKKGFNTAYFPVPKSIGERKSSVQVFLKQLKYQGISSSAKYIRNAEGRRIITKLRIRHAYALNNREYVQKKSYLWH